MTSIDELSGVGPAASKKLVEIGITEISELAAADIKTLVAGGITEGRAKTYIELAKDHKAQGKFKSGVAIREARKLIQKLTTNVPEFNDLMGGGIETSSITEFYGEFGSGKSQFSHQLAVNAQMPIEKGGLNGSVIYIDSETTFRHERIEQMVIGVNKMYGLKLDPDEVLNNIHLAEAESSEEQANLVSVATNIAQELAKTDKPCKLLIVDSLTANFRAEYAGRGELAERQQKLQGHMHALSQFARNFNAVVIVTNQVMSNPATFFGDPNKPIGGNIVGHSSKFRVYLKRSKKTLRICKLVDSPALPDGEAVIKVTNDGIVPPDYEGEDTSEE